METDNDLNSLALANNVYNAFFAETANSSTPSEKPPLAHIVNVNPVV